MVNLKSPRDMKSLNRQQRSKSAMPIGITDPKKPGLQGKTHHMFSGDLEPNEQTRQNQKRKKERIKQMLSSTSRGLDKPPSPEFGSKVNSAVLTQTSISDNDSDSDDELMLINTQKLMSQSPRKTSPVTSSQPVEKRPLEMPESLGKLEKTIKLQKTDKKTKEPDILNRVLAQPQTQNIEEIRTKFAHMNLPETIKSKKHLTSRVNNYLHIIPRLLDGTETMSVFYSRAKAFQKAGKFETMRQKDKQNIQWDLVTSGYFGSKRQHFISDLILSEYRRLVTDATKTNATVRFWGVADFLTYVLANEIVLRLVMEDFNCTIARAEDIVQSTVEYGSAITDGIDLEDELETEFESKPKSEIETSKKKRSDSLGEKSTLNDLIGLSSDEESD